MSDVDTRKESLTEKTSHSQRQDAWPVLVNQLPPLQGRSAAAVVASASATAVTSASRKDQRRSVYISTQTEFTWPHGHEQPSLQFILLEFDQVFLSSHQ